MNPIEAYEIFIAVRNHFITDSYNFNQYNGKVKISSRAFSDNRSKNLFAKLARKRPNKAELGRFIACNYAYSREDIWIDKLFETEAEQNYAKFQKYDTSSTYCFTQEIDSLGTISEILKVPASNSYPLLLKLLMTNQVSLETVIIMNSFIRFVPIWDSKISDPYLWPVYKNKIEKFAAFIRYDKEKCATVLKAHCEKYLEHI